MIDAATIAIGILSGTLITILAVVSITIWAAPFSQSLDFSDTNLTVNGVCLKAMMPWVALVSIVITVCIGILTIANLANDMPSPTDVPNTRNYNLYPSNSSTSNSSLTPITPSSSTSWTPINPSTSIDNDINKQNSQFNFYFLWNNWYSIWHNFCYWGSYFILFCH